MDQRGPSFAALVVAAFALLTATGAPATATASLPWTLDPIGCLGPASWCALYAATVPAKEALNAALLFLGTRVLGLPRIDEGSTKVRKLETLETVDWAYLALNSFVEFLGVNHILAFLLSGPLEHRLSEFGVANGPGAFVLAMLVNDLLYYPFHAVAHQRWFYPYCHKQHHRQFVPFRGYLDASNQHPFEQLCGFSIFLLGLCAAARTVGLHAGAAWVAFLAWATLNICNHLALDSRVHLPLPFPAYPRDHQMHHRFPQCNYSTLTTLFDRSFGSFRPYLALDPSAPATLPARPAAVPSPWSFAGLLVCLAAAAVAVEVARSGAPPRHAECRGLAASAAALAGAAALALAVERAAGAGAAADVARTIVGYTSSGAPGLRARAHQTEPTAKARPGGKA